MAKYRLAKAFESRVEKTENVLAVAGMFGLEVVCGEGKGSGRSRYVVLEDFEVRVEPGWVVYITGGSGTGKTTVLQLLKEQMGDADLHDSDESQCGEDVIDLADVEIVLGFRYRIVLGEDDAAIPAIDQDAWATNRKYGEANLAIALDDFGAVRNVNLRLLRSLNSDQWARSGMHAPRGKETMESMVRLYAADDLYHLFQIDRIRQAVEG